MEYLLDEHLDREEELPVVDYPWKCECGGKVVQQLINDEYVEICLKCGTIYG